MSSIFNNSERLPLYQSITNNVYKLGSSVQHSASKALTSLKENRETVRDFSLAAFSTIGLVLTSSMLENRIATEKLFMFGNAAMMVAITRTMKRAIENESLIEKNTNTIQVQSEQVLPREVEEETKVEERSILDLPPEVLEQIIAYAGPQCARICRLFESLTKTAPFDPKYLELAINSKNYRAFHKLAKNKHIEHGKIVIPILNTACNHVKTVSAEGYVIADKYDWNSREQKLDLFWQLKESEKSLLKSVYFILKNTKLSSISTKQSVDEKSHQKILTELCKFALKNVIFGLSKNVAISLINQLDTLIPAEDPAWQEIFNASYGEVMIFDMLEWLLQNRRVDPSRVFMVLETACSCAPITFIKLLLNDDRINPAEWNIKALTAAENSNRLDVIELLLQDPKVTANITPQELQKYQNLIQPQI